MTHIKLLVAAVACAFMGGCSAHAPVEARAPVAVAHAERTKQSSQALDRLAEESWAWVLETDNGQRDAAGLPFIGLKDVDLAEVKRDAAFARAMIARLEAIPAVQLDPDREVTRQFLLKFYRDIADGPDNWIFDFAITPYSGVLPLSGLIEYAAKRPLETVEHRAQYAMLVTEIGDLLDQMTSKTLVQADAGIYLPKSALSTLRATYSAVDAIAAQRLLPDNSRLEPLSALERDAFLAEISRLIETRITPGFAAIADTIDEDYEAKAPETIGLSQYPGGRARYQRAIETYTTMTMTPEEMHALGIELSEGLQAKLQSIRDSVGFEGSQKEFHQMLDSDLRFRVANAQELEALYREQIARIEPHVPAYFGRLPKAEYDIRRIPAANEGGVAFGYYEKPSSVEPKGLFRYNGANLDQRGLVQAAAINFHELIPGHHFHLALQDENENLPDIRRNLASLKLGAYNEGWAQYGANLAKEMGALKDEYELYGLVATDAMMAARLVVDTGVNALGWGFERARDYLIANTLMSKEQANAEVLRYASDVPAQALGYKLGHVMIDNLRTKAEAELGENFELRAFHDAILDPGAVPLDVLEKHIDRWIAIRKDQY